MKIFGLVDKTFAHSETAVAGVRSAYVAWDRDRPLDHDVVFFTDDEALRNSETDVGARIKVAWLIESQGIKPYLYRDLEALSKFDVVLTHSSQVLAALDNAFFVPGGGVWVGGTHAGGEAAIHQKTELCSMISSYKVSAPLHRRRLGYALLLKFLFSGRVKVFLGSRTVASVPATGPFAFNVCVENFIDDLYFTERLLNCFATGTIPLYLGSRSLPPCFEEKGVLRFDNAKQLVDLLKSATLDRYADMMPFVEHNFRAVNDFRSLEDYIWTNYGHMLGGSKSE